MPSTLTVCALRAIDHALAIATAACDAGSWCADPDNPHDHESHAQACDDACDAVCLSALDALAIGRACFHLGQAEAAPNPDTAWDHLTAARVVIREALGLA